MEKELGCRIVKPLNYTEASTIAYPKFFFKYSGEAE